NFKLYKIYNMNLNRFLISLLVLFVMVGCGKDDEENNTQDYSNILENIGNNVILATYEELDLKAVILVNSLTLLENEKTQDNLINARQAWRDTRQPWEQSEGFLYGPVDQKGIDPSMDSWPVNQTDLDAVLNSNAELTKSYIDGLDGTLKGFHTIEYLLFGLNSDKQIGDFTERQYQYLKSCAESLKGSTSELFLSWSPSGDNYISNVLSAGDENNSVYPSQKSALEEFVVGMITIADEVANGKINDPLVQKNVNLEESRFSQNSKKDFADNIRSIQNAYLGKYKGSEGKGINSLILSKDENLNKKVQEEIIEAIKSIENIEGSFTSAIFNSVSSVENAQAKVRQLQQTLESEVLPIVSNL
ncbi:MAG TPA: imelysin family protein, partial [Saprospiraceae bacterium]|nr:imelysin family protein [Saprospiraceae bacterium]